MQATRQQILDYLRERNGATVRELGDLLHLTATGIRQHLTILEQEGLVQSDEVRGRVGRPALRYTVSTQGESMFPKGYDDLANAIIEEVRQTYGMSGLQRVVKGVAHRLVEMKTNGRPTPAELDLAPADRVSAVVELFAEQGIIADWERSGDALLLHERTCPYPEVARQHPVVCAIDVQQLRELTGMDVHLQSCAVRGDSWCTYKIVAPKEPAEASPLR